MKNKILLTLWIILPFTLLIGCVYKSPVHLLKIAEVVELPENHKCTLLGQVYADNVYAFSAIGVEIARDKAKLQAEEIGATHVIWYDINSRGMPYALGKAYRCEM